VDFRSDKERIARNTKAGAKAVKEQNRLLKQQMKQQEGLAGAQAVTAPPVATFPQPPLMSQAPPGWYDDAAHPELLRWWSGAAWTDSTKPRQAQQVTSEVADQGELSPPPVDDVVETLTKLAALRDQGVLTEEEFAIAKAKILNRT